MVAILQPTFSNAFFTMKMYEFQFKFHWSLFLRVQLTIFQRWFRKWLGDQATSHYLNQWWIKYRRIYASLGLNELNKQYSRSTVLLLLAADLSSNMDAVYVYEGHQGVKRSVILWSTGMLQGFIISPWLRVIYSLPNSPQSGRNTAVDIKAYHRSLLAAICQASVICARALITWWMRSGIWGAGLHKAIIFPHLLVMVGDDGDHWDMDWRLWDYIHTGQQFVYVHNSLSGFPLNTQITAYPWFHMMTSWHGNAFAFMMTSSNGNIFRVTGDLCGEFTGPRWIPHTKASDAELWCFFDLRLNK